MNPERLKKELEALHKESYAWSLRCCLEDKVGAEDVLQNTYLKILSGRARYSGKALFKTWLFAVIRFTAIDYLKKQKRYIPFNQELNSTENEKIEIPVFSENGKEETYNLNAALKKLSPQQRQVLHLVFYQNLSIEEASKVMGIQVGTARTHYERGKKNLKKLLVNSRC